MAEGARVWFSATMTPSVSKAMGAGGNSPWQWPSTLDAPTAGGSLAGRYSELAGFSELRREVRFGEENSRADFCLMFADQPVIVEVKSVTLGFADTDVAAFPDAVTARGTKHLRELTALANSGQRAVLIYCVNLSGITAVRAAAEIDPDYAAALAEAKAAGVEVLAYGTTITAESIAVTHP